MEASVEQNEVRHLLESRSVVQGWLDKLEAQRGSVSERVLHRVREDYEDRLQNVLNALARHRQLVQDELDGATARLADAERDHAEAVDALEETRLRHVIGEIDEAAWTESSRDLEEATRAASERRDALSAETGRLRELLHQLDERTVDVPTPAFEGVAEPLFPAEEIPGSALAEEVAEDTEVEFEQPELLELSGGSEEYDAENASFLQQIDRALTELPSGALEEEEPIEDTAPKPGLKCPECGYTNDLSAWFCGVCGADVG